MLKSHDLQGAKRAPVMSELNKLSELPLSENFPTVIHHSIKTHRLLIICRHALITPNQRLNFRRIQLREGWRHKVSKQYDRFEVEHKQFSNMFTGGTTDVIAK